MYVNRYEVSSALYLDSPNRRTNLALAWFENRDDAVAFMADAAEDLNVEGETLTLTVREVWKDDD